MKQIIDKINNYHEEDKNEELLAFIDEVLSKEEYKDNFEILGFKGRTLNNLGRYEEARDVFFSTQEEGENDIKWNYRVAFSYYMEDRNEEVIFHTKKALNLIKEQNCDGDDIVEDIVYFLSWAYRALNMHQELYDLCIEYQYEKNSDWYLDISNSLYNLERKEESLEYLLKAKDFIVNSEKEEDKENLNVVVRRIIILSNILEKNDILETMKMEFPEICNELKELFYDEKELGEILGQLGERFGEYILIEDTDKSIPRHRVDLAVFPPNENRNHYLVSTIGMGYAIMNEMPEELIEKGLGRLELIFALPSDWDINSTLEEYTWPFEWARMLAKFPHNSDVWLGWGHTIPSDNNFAKNTKLCCIALSAPFEYLYENENIMQLDMCEEKITFLQMVPIYKEEMEYKLKYGMDALVELFGDNWSNVINIKRKNYALRSGFIGSNINKWSNNKGWN